MEKLNYKLIPIKNHGIETGKFAKCSPQHYEELMKYNWNTNKLTGGYPVTTGYFKTKGIKMHKYVITVIEKMKVPEGHLIDHIDTTDPDNELNNCLDNLRFLTPAQNTRNKRKRKNSSCNSFGVFYSKKIKKYQSQITLNGKKIHFGRFDSEFDAAMARDAYIVQNNLINEGFPLNFKEKIEKLKVYKIQTKKPKASKFKNVGQSNGFYVTQVIEKKEKIFYYRSINEIECAKKYDEFIVNNNLLYRELNFPEDYPNFNQQKHIKTFKIDIDCKRCKIKLNSTKETIIDIELYEKIKYYRLTYKKTNSGYEYVSIKIDEKNHILSRYLMNETNPKVVIDHINNDTLNNCLDNLRQSDNQRNSENKKKRKTENSTNYVGVVKEGKKYKTRLKSNGFCYSKLHLTEEYAAIDRDLQIVKNLPNSHYKKYFDWSIPGEIEKWEDLLFFEDLDMTVFKF